MDRAYPYISDPINLSMDSDYLTQLVSIPNCYPACLSIDILHTLPEANFYKITKYAQKPLK